MSYSFSAQATDKETLLAAVAAKFDEIVAQQPVHANDRAHATQMVADQLAVLDSLREGEQYSANVNGFLSWRGDSTQPVFTGYSAGAVVSIRAVPLGMPQQT